jgi:hypothetical protein
MRKIRNAYNVLIRKREGKKLVGRPKSRQKDNIKLGLKEVGVWRALVEW